MNLFAYCNNTPISSVDSTGNIAVALELEMAVTIVMIATDVAIVNATSDDNASQIIGITEGIDSLTKIKPIYYPEIMIALNILKLMF